MIYSLIIFVAVFSNANTAIQGYQTLSGQCPVAPNGVMGTCRSDCFKDDECLRGHKCCSNGCGYMCMDVYTECPAGSIQDPTNKSVCILCPAGHVPNSDKSGCERCPNGSIKDVTISLTSCQYCNTGRVPNSDQTDCLYCEGNTISTLGYTACTACPTGHLAIMGNSECILIRPLTFMTVDQSGRKDDNSKPKHAVDGNNATCAVTADRANPYWNGIFIDEMVVTSVTLSNVGAGDELPLLVTMSSKISTTEALCNAWYGESGSNPIINCPANIRGDSIKIKRITKEGKTRQLRICEILVQGYPVDEIGCKVYGCGGFT